MTFVLVGGGPTGVELAGSLGEIARDTLRRDFRAIDPTDARIVLVEAMDRVLPTLPGRPFTRPPGEQLERLGVTVRTDTTVTHIDDRCVRVRPTADAKAARGGHPDPDRAVGRGRAGLVVRPEGGRGRRRHDRPATDGSSSSPT